MKNLNRTFPFSNVHVPEAPSVPVWCLASVLDNKDRPAHDTAVHFVRSMECAVYVGPCRDIRCGLPERVRLGLGQTVSEVGLRDALSLPRAWTSPVFAEHD